MRFHEILNHKDAEFKHFYLDKQKRFVPKKICGMLVQWNLDLRKILGVDKIFLKSRSFLTSNTGKPLKVTNKP